MFVCVGVVFRELQGVDFRCASSSPRKAWVPSIYAVMADTVFPRNSLQTILQLQFFLIHISSSTISTSHLNCNYNIPFLTPKHTSFSTFPWPDEPATRNNGRCRTVSRRSPSRSSSNARRSYR